jgi:hypothetical protein
LKGTPRVTRKRRKKKKKKNVDRKSGIDYLSQYKESQMAVHDTDTEDCSRRIIFRASKFCPMCVMCACQNMKHVVCIGQAPA